MTRSSRHQEDDRQHEKSRKEEKIPTRGSVSIYKEEGTYGSSEKPPKKKSSKWPRFSKSKSSHNEKTRSTTKDNGGSSHLDMREVEEALPARDDRHSGQVLDTGDSDSDRERRYQEALRLPEPYYNLDSGSDSEREYYERPSHITNRSTLYTIDISKQLVSLEDKNDYKGMQRLYEQHKH